MANPKPEIWGAVNSWVYSELAYGIEGAGARFAGYAKPMTANFGDGMTQGYRGSLLRAINVTHKMTLNEKLDRSICPCGQSPDVSPWGKIAIFNENSDLSTTPSRIITDTNNINWFLCDRNQLGNNARYFSKVYNNGNNGGLAFQQFAPLANSPTNSYNSCMRLTPYVYYGLRSFVATIQVHLLPKNGTYDDITVNSIWTNLDNWITYKETHDLIGLRLFFRNCTALNASTLVLTYNNDTSQYGGQYSNQIAVIQDLTVNNNGNNVETEFLSLNMESGVSYRSGYIFDVCNVQNYPSSDNRRTNGVLPCWEYFDGQQIKRWKTPDNYDGAFWYTIPYSQANYDKIMKIAALFGCFFTPTTKYTFNYDMLDNDLYLPILDNNGVGHGQYTRGADNANNPLYTVNSIRDINYNPDTPPVPVDTNTYNNTTVFNVIGAGASMNKRYLLNAANVAKLSTDLFDICDDMSTGSDYSFFDSKVKANMLTQSPIDSVVSLIRYPFTPTHGSTKQAVKLGRFEASAEGYPISNAIQTITFAGVDIFPRFGNNFLDYEPYTKYEVYVPFCDTVELSAADILGHTLNVRLVVDLFTGVCTGYILADSLCIETTSGNVGVSLPLTGLDTATINANIANAEANKKAAKKNYIKGHFDIITQKDKVGALWTQILGTNEDVVKKADYDLKHIETPMHTIGAASPLTSWAMDLNARVIIYYPTGDAITDNTPPELRDLTTYGHTTGFATIDNATLSSYSGFTVATNPILNFAATKTEKEMIESALNGGIFI